MVSTHSRPKAAAKDFENARTDAQVSTHSRPKAAASQALNLAKQSSCFNTQPPEGGCNFRITVSAPSFGFQHTAARRRLPY